MRGINTRLLCTFVAAGMEQLAAEHGCLGRTAIGSHKVIFCICSLLSLRAE